MPSTEAVLTDLADAIQRLLSAFGAVGAPAIVNRILTLFAEVVPVELSQFVVEVFSDSSIASSDCRLFQINAHRRVVRRVVGVVLAIRIRLSPRLIVAANQLEISH